MTSGSKTIDRVLRRGALAAALLLVSLPVAALDQAGLMQLLAQRSSGEARFTEQRFVSGIEQPLAASGRLAFRAPDRVERITEQPRAESFVAEGNRVTLERGGRKRQVMLDAVPEMAAFVAALRGTLTGDATVLQQYFQASVTGDAARWSIELLPLEPQIAAVLRRVRLSGQRSDLRQVELQLADGDRSLMTIEPLAAKSP